MTAADVFDIGGIVMIVLILASLMFLEPFLALVGATRRKIAQRGSQAAKTAPPASRRELETSSFEAYTHCGGCGKLDYHPMREPTPTPAEYEEAVHKLLRHMRDIGWGGDVAHSIVDQRRPAVLEVAFDVIRTCSCGHSWGQK